MTEHGRTTADPTRNAPASAASPTRRRLLQVGLGGAALLAIGGLGLTLWRPGGNRTPPTTLLALDGNSWLVLAAVASRVAPGIEGFPSADEIGVASKVDALLHGTHPATVAEIRRLLGLLENPVGGLLLDGRIGSFTGASPEDQDAILRGWRDSEVGIKRAGYKALAGLCASAYFADPRVYPHLGYPGPPNYGNVPTKEAG